MTTADGAGSRGPYAKGVQRRREILDRTLDVVAERGIDGTSLRAIGDAIGVSHAALRHYFSSREALLLEVLRERDVESTSRIADVSGTIERMAAAADHNVGVPGLVTLYTTLLATSVEPGNEESAAFFRARFAEARADLSEQIRAELAEAGRSTEVDVESVANLVIAAFDGLQVQWLLDRSVDIAGTLRLIARVLD